MASGSSFSGGLPDSADDAESKHGRVKKAMALRVKYRKTHRIQTKAVYTIQLALRSLGVHVKSRGGVYPNSEAVEDFGRSLLENRFSREEADHLGICVENVPSNLQGGQCLSLKQYNKECTASDAQLGTCFDDDRDLLRGTLSHSHITLVLLCWISGAHWELPRWCNEQDCLDLAAAAEFANAALMMEVIQEGIETEVPDYRIYLEEPSGCSSISQALNTTQAIALKTGRFHYSLKPSWQNRLVSQVSGIPFDDRVGVGVAQALTAL